MGEEILRLESIVKEFYGVRALDGVSFDLREGECHALVGENGAGKSTLMKVVSGEYQPTAGSIYFRGKKVSINKERDALDLGIAIVAQELNPVPVLTIAENIFLGRYPDAKIKGLIDLKKINAATQQYLDEFGLPLSATTKLSRLSMAQVQIVEIIKAVSRNAKIIILDEPSSAITESETQRLMEHIERLKETGIAFVYISHKMDEIFKVADRVTVIRDGAWISTKEADETNIDETISFMVGRQLGDYIQRGEKNITDRVVLQVKNLTHPKLFRNISFDVHAGEILGIAGLMGAGRTEVANGIFGMYDKTVMGEIFLEGEKIRITHPKQAVKHGIIMISEDRRNLGIIPRLTIRHNIGLPNMDRFAPHFFVDKKLEFDAASKYAKLMGVKAPHIDVPVSKLSGGNQQKVVLAKWLIRDIKVLIMDEPTRGIDVGAKHEIYKLMSQFAREGMAIIMISSELPEIVGMSDRVLVMSGGEIKGELKRTDTGIEEITQENIMQLAVK